MDANLYRSPLARSFRAPKPWPGERDTRIVTSWWLKHLLDPPGDRITYFRRFLSSRAKKLAAVNDESERRDLHGAISLARHFLADALERIDEPSCEAELTMAFLDAEKSEDAERLCEAASKLARFYTGNHHNAEAEYLYLRAVPYAHAVSALQVSLLLQNLAFLWEVAKLDEDPVCLLGRMRSVYDRRPLDGWIDRGKRLIQIGAQEALVREAAAPDPKASPWEVGRAAVANMLLGRMEEARRLRLLGMRPRPCHTRWGMALWLFGVPPTAG